METTNEKLLAENAGHYHFSLTQNVFKTLFLRAVKTQECFRMDKKERTVASNPFFSIQFWHYFIFLNMVYMGSQLRVGENVIKRAFGELNNVFQDEFNKVLSQQSHN